MCRKPSRIPTTIPWAEGNAGFWLPNPDLRVSIATQLDHDDYRHDWADNPWLGSHSLMRQVLGAVLLIGACRIRYSGERRRFPVVVINRLHMGNIKPMPDAGSR